MDEPWEARATGEGVPSGRLHELIMKIGHSCDWRTRAADGGKEVGVEAERGWESQHLLLQHDHKEVVMDQSGFVCEQSETESVLVCVGEAVVHVDGRVAFS